jgi:hypothetical protein
VPNERSLDKADIEDVSPEVPLPEPDHRAEKEWAKNFPSKSELTRRRYHQETQRMLREERLRITTAQWLFAAVVVWMFAILAIVICHGLGWMTISDHILIALLSTTSVNVIGLLYVVVRYLFPDATKHRRTK